MAEIIGLHLIFKSIFGNFLFVRRTTGVINQNVETRFVLYYV